MDYMKKAHDVLIDPESFSPLTGIHGIVTACSCGFTSHEASGHGWFQSPDGDSWDCYGERIVRLDNIIQAVSVP